MNGYSQVKKQYQWLGPKYSKYFWTFLIDMMDVIVVTISAGVAFITLWIPGVGEFELISLPAWLPVFCFASAIIYKIMDIIQFFIAKKVFIKWQYALLTPDWILFDPLTNMLPSYTLIAILSDIFKWK